MSTIRDHLNDWFRAPPAKPRMIEVFLKGSDLLHPLYLKVVGASVIECRRVEAFGEGHEVIFVPIDQIAMLRIYEA